MVGLPRFTSNHRRRQVMGRLDLRPTPAEAQSFAEALDDQTALRIYQALHHRLGKGLQLIKSDTNHD